MMGLVKEYMLERHDEEMGASPLSWSDVKRALRFLLATEEMGATWFSVLQRIDTLSGDAPCGFPKITRVRGLNHP